jgi:hypothetical protein
MSLAEYAWHLRGGCDCAKVVGLCEGVRQGLARAPRVPPPRKPVRSPEVDLADGWVPEVPVQYYYTLVPGPHAQGQMQVHGEGDKVVLGVGLEKGVVEICHGSFAIGGRAQGGVAFGEGASRLVTTDREQGEMNSWSNLELRPVARRRWEVMSTGFPEQTRWDVTL